MKFFEDFLKLEVVGRTYKIQAMGVKVQYRVTRTQNDNQNKELKKNFLIQLSKMIHYGWQIKQQMTYDILLHKTFLLRQEYNFYFIFNNKQWGSSQDIGQGGASGNIIWDETKYERGVRLVIIINKT